MKVDPRVIGLHLPVDRSREQTPCQDRIPLEHGLSGGRQLVGFGRDDGPGLSRQALRRFDDVRHGTHFDVGEAGIAPAEDETGLCSVDGGRASRQLHSCFPPQRHGGKIRRDGVRKPVFNPLLEKPIVGPRHTRTGFGRPPEPGRRHLSACNFRQFSNVGGHVVEECLTIPANLDRVASARAAAPIRRRSPGDPGADAVRVVDRGVHEPAGDCASLWDRGGGAARLVQGDDVERRSEALRAAVRRPADGVGERVHSHCRGFFDCTPVGAGRHRFPSILGWHPLLECAPVNLGHDEALGTLPEEMRRHQFDGLPTR